MYLCLNADQKGDQGFLDPLCVVYIIWPGYPTFFAIFVTLIAMYLIFMKKFYHLHVKN